MGRNPRVIPANSLQHVVDVAFQNSFLLTPGEEMNDLFTGALGRAQTVYGMKICAAVVLGNHWHLLLRPRDAAHLAAFMGYLKTNLSKEIGRLRGWSGSLFRGRYQAITVSDEPSAQVAVLRYVLSQGVKEDLVDSVLDWPGVHCARSLLDGRPLTGSWHDRSREYRARRSGADCSSDEFSTVESVTFSPIPCWEHETDSVRRGLVAELIADIDREAAERRRREGKTSLGVAKVLAQDPTERPKKVPKSPQPLFHAVDRRVWTAMLAAWRELIQSFREASEELRSGNRNARFPEGTFPPSLPFVPFSDASLGGAGHFPIRGRP